MAYRDLEDIRDSNSGWDYTELFEMMAEKELSFSEVKKICLLSKIPGARPPVLNCKRKMNKI